MTTPSKADLDEAARERAAQDDLAARNVAAKEPGEALRGAVEDQGIGIKHEYPTARWAAAESALLAPWRERVARAESLPRFAAYSKAIDERDAAKAEAAKLRRDEHILEASNDAKLVMLRVCEAETAKLRATVKELEPYARTVALAFDALTAIGMAEVGAKQEPLGIVVRIERAGATIQRLSDEAAKLRAVVEALPRCVMGVAGTLDQCPNVATRRHNHTCAQGDQSANIVCERHAVSWHEDLPYAAALRALDAGVPPAVDDEREVVRRQLDDDAVALFDADPAGHVAASPLPPADRRLSRGEVQLIAEAVLHEVLGGEEGKDPAGFAWALTNYSGMKRIESVFRERLAARLEKLEKP